ncbi:hypothetical protein ABW20_dc0100196 [Dactylellina cionopaga]|nr:hypothetical protein ABW20_dc0100196 [Dactylellina cionopaga]
MNSLKSIAKGGWHPDSKSKSSSSPSSGGNERFKNFKGLQQVASWTGHGTKGDSKQDSDTVTARPLTSLKDPYSFGAPPRRDPKAPLPPPTQSSVLGGEVPPPIQEEPQPPAEEEPPRPRSFQVNTTGISTTSLPAPPKRILGTTSTPSPPLNGRPTPPLPSRAQPPPLPGRQTSGSTGSQETASPFPTISGPGFTSSTSAASARLAQAGVSVPGFNIGTQSPPLPSRSRPTPPPRGSSQDDPVSSPPPYSIGELSGRLASLRPSSSSSSPSTPKPQAETPSTGTSWSQKQAALKTASQFRKDPSSVSLSEAAAAAKTADNFRQRHGDQVAQGYQRAQAAGLVDDSTASGSGEPSSQATTHQAKWGALASRVSKTASQHTNNSNPPDAGPERTGTSALASVAAKKKPPPPPKPRDLEPTSLPPPIPLGSKPR